MRILCLLALAGALIYFITYMKFKNYIPILMYHRIADNPGDRNSLPAEKFEEQLQYLKEQGYNTITPEEFLRHYNKQGDLPKKSIMLTFDDGYTDTYEVALPLLQKYGMKAVVFPIANWLGKENKWENTGKALTTTMTVEELKKWLAAGMAVASHSMNHHYLSKCDLVTVQKELQQSKEELAKLLGQEMDYICYPYGAVNKQVASMAKEVGYKLGFAIFENAPLWNIDPLRLPRVPIAGHQSLREFKQKISPFHVVLLYLRQWERSFKRIFK